MPIEAAAPGEAAGATEFMGLRFDRLDLAGAAAWIDRRAAGDAFAYVVTPNVDHMLRVEADPGLRAIYRAAALCLCDSRILLKLARWAGVTLTLAPGSDLTPRLLARAEERGDDLALVGGDGALLARLRARYPAIRFRQHLAPMGLSRDAAARTAAALFTATSGARLVLLAVGSPQQELIAAAAAQLPRARGTALCIGASLDFVTGRQRRAPRIVRRLSLEWAWRLASEPRRLARRYLVEGVRIFPAALRWKQAQATARRS